MPPSSDGSLFNRDPASFFERGSTSQIFTHLRLAVLVVGVADRTLFAGDARTPVAPDVDRIVAELLSSL